MSAKRRRKMKWRHRIGYGCMTLVFIGILALFAFASLTESRSAALRKDLVLPEFVAQRAEFVAPKEGEALPQVEEASGAPTGEEAKAATDAFFAGWEKAREHLRREAWRVENLFDRVGRLGARDENWERLNQVLRENPELVALATDVARSGLPLGMDISPELPLKMQGYRWNRGIRICGGILAVDARMKAEAGDAAGAGESLLDALRLAETFSVLPHGFAHDIRRNTQQAVLSVLNITEPGVAATPEQAREIMEHLATAHHRQQSIDRLGFEAFSDIEVVDDLMTLSSGDFLARHAPGDGDDPAPKAFIAMLGSPIAAPFLRHDENIVMEAWQRMRDVADLPYPEAKSVLDAVREDLGEGFAMGPARSTVRQMYRILVQQYELENQIDLARVGLAVELYRGEQGAYPVNLDAVAELLGGEVPRHVYDGQPLEYAVTEKGYTLQGISSVRGDAGVGGRVETSGELPPSPPDAPVPTDGGVGQEE